MTLAIKVKNIYSFHFRLTLKLLIVLW